MHCSQSVVPRHFPNRALRKSLGKEREANALHNGGSGQQAKWSSTSRPTRSVAASKTFPGVVLGRLVPLRASTVVEASGSGGGVLDKPVVTPNKDTGTWVDTK